MLELETRIQGIPCIIKSTDCIPYTPAHTEGPSDRWLQPEGSPGKWVVCDRNGRPALWLERKLTKEDRVRIEEQIMLAIDEEISYHRPRW